MSVYTPSKLLEKLQKLTDTQESIQTLSNWIRYHTKYHTESVSIWTKEIYSLKTEDRKLLFLYLANDLLQESRKKGNEFVKEFKKIIEDVIVFVWKSSSEMLQGKLMRLLNIWDQRKVFPSEFIKNIMNVVNALPAATEQPIISQAAALVKVPQSSLITSLDLSLNKDDVSDLDIETIQEKFKTYEDYQDMMQNVEKIVSLMNQSSNMLPHLSETEEKVKEIAPNSMQFSKDQIEDIKKGELVGLQNHMNQLKNNDVLLQDYKNQLEEDITLTSQIQSLLNALAHNQTNRIKQVQESYAIAEKLLKSNKVLQTKLEQRIRLGQGSPLPNDFLNFIKPKGAVNNITKPPTTISSGLLGIKRPIESLNLDPNGAIRLNDYKRQKLATQNMEAFEYIDG